MKTTFLWILGALAALLAWASTFVVAESEVAIVSRFGDPRRLVSEAGLHLKWPAPIDSVTQVDSRVHVLDPEPREYLTADNTNVMIDAFIAWRVSDPRQFLVAVRDREGAEARLADVLLDSVGTVLSRGPFDDLVSIEEAPRDLDAVTAELTTEVSRRVLEDGFGVSVNIAGIKRVNYNQSNKPHVFARMQAERQSVAEGERSEGRREASGIQDEASLFQARTLGEADREAQRIRGEATAEAARLRQEGWSRYPRLAPFLRSAEVLGSIQNDSTILMRADNPLLEMFNPAVLMGEDNPAAAKGPASTEQQKSGGQ